LGAAKLRGLGPKTLAKLEAAGIATDGDLLTLLPRDYLDYTQAALIPEAPLDEPVHVHGVVISKKASITARQKMHLLEILVDDGYGTMRALWFNQPYLDNAIHKGEKLSLFGKIKFDKLGRTMNSPKFRKVEDSEAAAGVTPVYREIGGLRSEQLRRWIAMLIADMPAEETLPAAWVAREGFPSRKEAFRTVHAPVEPETAKAVKARTSPAWRRLAFEEFLTFQRRLREAAARSQRRDHPRLTPDPAWLDAFYADLPFAPTNDQRQAIAAMTASLAQGRRLQAMVQGDVGSGKTLAALAMAYVFFRTGYQAALLCPTALLARQHQAAADAILGPLGVRTVLLTGQLSAADLRERLESLASGHANLAIGAHKLFQEDVRFHNLGLAMVDEQHRFGVEQRKALLQKGAAAHYVAFSATPIPRSLAMTLYGEYQTLQIREKPAGRQPVKTILKKAENRDEIIRFARARIDLGESVFWVFPLIEDDAAQQEQSAIAMHREFRQSAFPPEWVGLAHGRMDKDRMQEEMAKFAAGERKVLVATTVVEVGVDIPAASIMVVEGADRFGLSQLHQLRGRVGRGGREGFCFLTLAADAPRSALRRMKRLLATDDGFEIAAYDLEERGAGELLGKRQSGAPDFRIGDAWRDRELMALARECAGTVDSADV